MWLALSIESHPHYQAAQRWYRDASIERGHLVLCRATEMSVLRHLTQAAFMRGCDALPLTNSEAVTFLSNIYADSAVSRENEPDRTRELWLDLARAPCSSPLIWMDAYLASFAICLGAEMVTFDRGFLNYRHAGLSVTLLQNA